jgi:hypothetical protein
LLPSNCGFDVAGGWSPYFAERFAGQPLKSVALRIPGPPGSPPWFERKGEFVATASGVEGSFYSLPALAKAIPNVARLNQELSAQKQSNTRAEQVNQRMEAEIRDLREGLEIVEEKARSELGMVKPNEIFVQVVK